MEILRKKSRKMLSRQRKFSPSTFGGDNKRLFLPPLLDSHREKWRRRLFLIFSISWRDGISKALGASQPTVVGTPEGQFSALGGINLRGGGGGGLPSADAGELSRGDSQSRPIFSSRESFSEKSQHTFCCRDDFFFRHFPHPWRHVAAPQTAEIFCSSRNK